MKMMMASSLFLRRGQHQLHLANISRFHGQKGILSSFLSTSTSTHNDLVLSTVNEGTGVAMLTMNRPPANSLSLEMNEAISNSIKSIESNPNIQSLILASSNPTIFSAGLDVSELVAPDEERLPKFWNSLQQVCLDLYGSRLATIAAIQGHAPAAGCFLAMACDWRIMYAGDSESHLEGKKRHVPTIGLNETKLGIAAPPWMGQLMVRTIGFRQAERALALGTLFPPDQALKVGLVDDVVGAETVVDDLSDGVLQELLPGSLQDHNYDSVLQVAYQEALKYAKIHSQARVASKLVTRSDFLKDLTVNREADTEHFCGFIGQDLVQKNLRGYVQALKKRSKKN